jgi:two-component system C4-dicarboxylate transport response regulator DctD
MSGPIVYIDDEPALCRATRMVLELAEPPVPIETFTDPLAAIDYINANDVLAVICDYRMPKISGLQVLDKIRRDVPFYVVSGDLDIAQWTDGNPRITGTLPKPYKADLLLRIVEALRQ